jgi:pimeloyl-ACP methyl ester carboxylesterase
MHQAENSQDFKPGEPSAPERRVFLQAAIAAPLAAAGLAALKRATAQTPPSAPSPAQRNVFVKHAYEERQVALGEIEMNYVVVGAESHPALLLIPPQVNSWWNYEAALALLSEQFQCFAVDLRGQGRSTWTPRRYTLDNIGNDLVRFIDLVIKRPTLVSGNSSGGVAAAWLSAYAKPGQIRGALCEDPPLFSGEVSPRYGHAMRQTSASEMFEIAVIHLGDQWKVGDWAGFTRAAGDNSRPSLRALASAAEPPQNWKEYDPEWARASLEGTLWGSCPHDLLLAQVKTPVLLTHHARQVLPETGQLRGAMSDVQAEKAREILAGTGVPFEYHSAPDAAHVMHNADPPRFAKILSEWARKLPA